MHVKHGDIQEVHTKDVDVEILLLSYCVLRYVVLGHYLIQVKLYKYLLSIEDVLQAVQLLSTISHSKHYSLQLIH